MSPIATEVIETGPERDAPGYHHTAMSVPGPFPCTTTGVAVLVGESFLRG